MKRIFLVLVLLSQMASAKVLTATYEISYGIFQTMGIADARFETRDNDTYSIRIEARTTGIAKLLSNNRVEVYESHGTIVNGKLVPNKYIKIRRTDSKKTTKRYTFDHRKKTVLKEVIEGVDYDEESNDFYAPEDILSLFFNVKQYMKLRQNQVLYAIGANKNDGRIDVVFPRGKELERLEKELEMGDGVFVKVMLNDKIFSSANGELLINLDEEGLCKKAILEDVLLFGDIVGKRVR
ncbi:DUF3108 domain-containing protein [Sulfuricurvum sp.]|uniref:DUF3108 domain-containing protein n=1 Tax=Sulfuricurvum sp. TaxID=2025608 RepID=UPI0019BF036B|nr:DUF3108 domain-containing protein [Sulfuricurvum sp.]MBD3799135.1 DUF3108 domain-containing protein [Campylobacterota bacterium]MBD3806597.1 DUF3108 domain-containing protein [Sulfuricurvum sp.]